MAEELGILVTSDKHLDHLINIARAARNKGKEVRIFFTNKGLLLTHDPRFKELESLAEMSLCRVMFETLKLDKNKPIPGIPDSGFATQAKHADMIYHSDRFLVL